ncbi:eukaryotic aspartyl protease [Ancylostoma duodenale]|uniref:Eukaryotic aspartyl protease n=1 Tax=Ancylostoma duodenale TaxID=51022 RepID=A0A0C2DLK1_9BILA|nr:eukaryotic aspartyl protease [Ancylostoma duodenale]
MQSTLLLCTVVGLTMAAVYQTPLVKIESPRIRMMRKGTWREAVKQRNAARIKAWTAALAAGDIYRQNVNDYYDTQYIANVTVGTPETTFQVVLDTGSADFWIPDLSCVLPPKGEGCEGSVCDYGGKHAYDWRTSETAKQKSGKWEIEYGTGSASGEYSKDIVRFGDVGEKRLEVPDTVVGRATKIAEFFKDIPMDGILGLAFQAALTSYNIQPPFVRAYQLKLVDPIFTVHMRSVGDAENVFGGVFTYGGIDTENCDKEITYVKLQYPALFQFEMQAVSIGNFYDKSGWEVISDTGTSFIGAPTRIADAIAKAAGARVTEVSMLSFVPFKNAQ